MFIHSEEDEFVSPTGSPTKEEMYDIINVLRNQMDEISRNLEFERAEKQRMTKLFQEKQEELSLPPIIGKHLSSSLLLSCSSSQPAVVTSPTKHVKDSTPLTTSSMNMTQSLNLSLPSASQTQVVTSIPSSITAHAQQNLPLQSTECRAHNLKNQHYINDSIPSATKDYQQQFELQSPYSSHDTIYQTPYNSTPCPSVSGFTGARKKIIDLPQFTGEPEEWPVFQVAFNESNAFMRYSNLIRT